MIETYYAGVNWRGRPESAVAYAQRAERYFRLLAPLDPTWTQWFCKAATLEQALKLRIDPVASTFEALFALKKHQLFEGYILELWNGEHRGMDSQFADAATTSFSCGHASRFTPNVCVLSPPNPTDGPVGERIVTAPIMTQVLRAMALAWEPDRGVAMSHSYREKFMPDKLPPVLVGWVTYLSRRRGTVPPSPGGCACRSASRAW